MRAESARPSIRRFLLYWMLASVGVAWSLGAVLIYTNSHREFDAIFDAQLTQSARIIMARAAHEQHERHEDEDDEDRESRGLRLHRYEQAVRYQVWDRGELVADTGDTKASGTTTGTTPGMTPGTTEKPRALSDAEGFSDRTLEGRSWRVFGLRDRKRDLLVLVAHEHSIREDLATRLTLKIVLPLLLLLPALGGLVWWGVGRGLRSLNFLARSVERRAPEDLAPLRTAQAPLEVQPLILALNHLLERLSSAFENERRFTSDAAHELRTPLAGLKAQAEVALGATNQTERDQALRKIVTAVDRSSHLVSQMLLLARLDREKAMGDSVRVSLRKLASECLADIAPDALARGVEVGIEGTDGEIVGNATMISVLLRNLIDNAVRYSSKGGKVDVRIQESEGRVVLDVRDSGPGVTSEELTKLFDRFYRGHHATGSGFVSGSGLGLSIVKRIAELHGAVIEAASPASGGFEIRVRFVSAGSARPG